MNLEALLAKLKNIKLTKGQQQYSVLGVVVAAALVYGYWTQLLVPLNKKIVQLEKDLQEQESKLAEAKRIKERWEEYEERLMRTRIGMEFVGRRIPMVQTNDMLLRQFQILCQESGLVFGGFSPSVGATVRTEYEGTKKLMAMVDFICDYHQFGVFLSRLSAEQKVYTVENVQITPNSMPTRKGSVRVTMSIVTYCEARGLK